MKGFSRPTADQRPAVLSQEKKESRTVSELTTGIPAGRLMVVLMVVRRGTSAGTATEVPRFQLHAAATITEQ